MKRASLRAPVLAAVLIGLHRPRRPRRPVTLRFGQIPSTVRAVTSVYLFVAEHKGFLAREGISLDFVPIEGGTDKMVAALDAGTVDVAHTATPYLIQAELAGSRCGGDRGRGGESGLQPDRAAGDRQLCRPEGKADRPFARRSTRSRSPCASCWRRTGSASADYTVKELVGTPVRFDCLKSGECAGRAARTAERFRSDPAGLPPARRFHAKRSAPSSSRSSRCGAPSRRPTRRRWCISCGRWPMLSASSAIRPTGRR